MGGAIMNTISIKRELNFDVFEETLTRKVVEGRTVFTGRRTGTRYEIQKTGCNRRTGYSVFADGRALKTSTSLYSVAWVIWDRELGRN